MVAPVIFLELLFNLCELALDSDAVLVGNGKHDLRGIEGGKIVFDVIAHAIGAAEDAN